MARLVREDGSVLSEHVEMATSLWSRFIGLMGRRELPAGHALYIKPCSSIHMFFMRFAIDAVFLDAEGRVLRVYERLHPWRVTRVVRRAKACVEMPAGGAAGVAPGTRLVLEGAS